MRQTYTYDPKAATVCLSYRTELYLKLLFQNLCRSQRLIVSIKGDCTPTIIPRYPSVYNSRRLLHKLLNGLTT